MLPDIFFKIRGMFRPAVLEDV